MTRRSSNKRNRKAKAKRVVPSEHETSTTSIDAREVNTTGSQASDPKEDFESTTSPASSYNKQARRVEGETSLYEAVFNGKSFVEGVVDEWIVKYEANKDDGLNIIMQFFLTASGCKEVITPEMGNLPHDQLIERITEAFDEGNADYPIVKADGKFKKFKLNYCEFVQRLVYQCSKFILYDGFFMDNVISWLVGLSNTKVRAFRHTATLAVMKMMSTLANVAVIVSMDLEKISRLYNDESQEDRNAKTLEYLGAKASQLKVNLNEVKYMLSYIFKSNFVHRYNDVLPEIRAICIEEIGVCIKMFPKIFLKDLCLNYIGWTLHDRVGGVRLKCVQALQPLYASEEWKNQLQGFTKQFRDRILAMIWDKEDDIGEQAFKLVISIQNYGHAILSDKECKSLNDSIYFLNRAVAQAAAEFVNEKFFTSNENVEVETKSGKKRLPNTSFMKDLVQFYIKSEQQDLEPYLVDSLIEINKMLKDWECMIDLLLEEPGPNEKEPLDNQKETCLIKIMTCCIKQAATGEIPYGRAPARKVVLAKKIKQVQDDKQKMTEHFVGVLPLLLEKYRNDPEKLANLMSIPQYFELGVYSADEQERNLDSLMGKITEIVDVSLDVRVLDEAAKTLEHMCNPESATYVKCNGIKLKMIDAIKKKYTEAIHIIRSAIEEKYKPSDVDISCAQESLKKFACFFSYHDLNYTSLYNSLLQDIIDRVLPAEAIKYCITACFSSIIWCQSVLIESADDENEFDRKCQNLERRLGDFMEFVSPFIGDDDVPIMIREEAYITVCNLLVIFNNNLTTQANPQLDQMIYKPDIHLTEVLSKFVQQRVFSDTERVNLDEELHNRRNFLSRFCKLVIYNILPAEAAADVFKHYVEYGDVYGDVIKVTISKTRDNDKIKCALALQRSLKILYNELTEENRRESSSEEFKSIKELAKRFALFFGNDAGKNREAIIALHKRGIMFAASLPDGVEPTGSPPNLHYLEILNIFTTKLVKQEKKTVLNFLNDYFKVSGPEKDWQPLLLYRKGLLRDEKANATTPNNDPNISL